MKTRTPVRHPHNQQVYRRKQRILESAMLRKTVRNNLNYFLCNDVQDRINNKQDLNQTYCFSFQFYLPQFNVDVVCLEDIEGNEWIEENDLARFLTWYKKEIAPAEHLGPVQAILRLFTTEKKQKRSQARKWRWHVAHRQEYKCNCCGDLLHPDCFDIDHIREIRDGGKDQYSCTGDDNLQAICVSCHAKKTRKRTRIGGDKLSRTKARKQVKSKYF